MKGDEVLKEIKAHAQLGKIPVVIFTTTCEPKEISALYALGASGFIVKPSDIN